MLKNTPKHVLGYNLEDCMRSDEDINPYTGPTTPTEPAPTSLPTTPNPETFQGPITRARARDLNYVILLRNEEEDSVQE